MKRRIVKVKVGDHVSVPSHRITKGVVSRLVFTDPKDGQFINVKTSTGNIIPVWSSQVVKGRRPTALKRATTRRVRRATRKVGNPSGLRTFTIHYTHRDGHVDRSHEEARSAAEAKRKFMRDYAYSDTLRSVRVTEGRMRNPAKKKRAAPKRRSR
jgi:hypothetical protein